VWTRDQLARAWFDKGGVGIVFTQPAAAASALPGKN